MTKPNPVERALEGFLFASRWLMAPFYLGLVVTLGGMLIAFLRDLAEHLPGLMAMTETGVILWALGLIDLSLVGNLLFTVILAGYENFVSKMDSVTHADWPSWMGKIDFSGMKLKLISSIAAIAAIHLLEIFMTPEKLDTASLGWLIAIVITIVVIGLLLAVMDYINERTKALVEKN
jgi:uncharacterized protein (TIGR00645 family)